MCMSIMWSVNPVRNSSRALNPAGIIQYLTPLQSNGALSLTGSTARRITMNFQGYRRADGRAGTRNYVLIIPSVGCSQGVSQAIAQGLKGAIYLPNILGCGQMGEDRMLVKKTLVGFGTNPNVFAVLDRWQWMRTAFFR